MDKSKYWYDYTRNDPDRENPFENEHRILVNSPLVETYDRKPEMSCYQVCDELTCAISKKKIPIEKLNYWNVELQEAYYSPKEVKQRYDKINSNLLHLLLCQHHQ